MSYKPEPIDTSKIKLPLEILQLKERLAENIHEIWADQRIRDGWSYGIERNDRKKEHPSLVPYHQLSESEKLYDRKTAMETLKIISLLGYEIKKK